MTEETSYGDCKRTKIYYCDVRSSNQKAMCEKKNTEIRKIIPKRNKIDFDELDEFDIAYINSHINSQPRKSLGGHSQIQLFKKMYGSLAEKLLNLLGIQEISKSKLNLTFKGIIKDGKKREKELWGYDSESENE